MVGRVWYPRMTRVVGLDLSLTCTGIAVCMENGRGVSMASRTVTSTGRRSATLPERHSRLTALGADIVHSASTADLVVVEGLFNAGASAGALVDRAALFWFVVGALVRREVPVAVVAPSALKLAMTGSGKADKAALATALVRLWPETDVTSSDVSDAAGLAHLGAVALGMGVPVLERHRRVKWTEWPLFGTPTASVS
jgi:Holliday junction resolvasome RuvABC endonuclease subunit